MRHYIVLLAAAIMVFASCGEKYEEHHDTLKVSHRVVNVGNEDTVIQVIVYYDGKWEGYVQDDCDWLKIRNPRGEGVSVVHVEVASGDGTDRTGTLHFRAGDDEEVINIRQK